MCQKNADFEYVRQIKGHSKEGMKEQVVRAIADFYNPQIGKVKGMKGFLLMESLNDQNEIINMTFWKTKEDCDAYYSQDKTYAAILEKTVSLREGVLEMTDYTLAKFRIG
jgi:heme-degrading monooxygenase HmoA